VYLSAYAGGPKLQVSYKRGADHVYPPDGARAWPVKLNESQELTIRVRGRLVNVAVNGRHALAYRLPIPRRTGAIELMTYDAKAEFTAFELSALPAGVKLVSPGAAVPAGPLMIEDARLGVVAAEKALAVANLQPEALKSVVAADRAK